jgi:octaprenyl-diphosphate synthase
LAFDFLARELAQVDRVIARAIEGDEQTLTGIASYVVGSGGKRVRPALVLASYVAASGSKPRLAVPAAAAVEVIHTATLIHDDISDQSERRRGKASAHRTFGIGRSLIAADYLMTTAFKLVSEYGVEFISTINGACLNMAIGEIQDLRHSRNPALTEAEYFEIIGHKTGALFEAALKLGAMAARAPPREVAAFGRYGREVGLAFQIVDDALDVSASAKRMGKPVGKDLAEGKVTLPTIFALRHAPPEDRTFLRRVIETPGEGAPQADIRRAIKIIRLAGGEAEARAQALRHTKAAQRALKAVSPSRGKRDLIAYADELAARGA